MNLTVLLGSFMVSASLADEHEARWQSRRIPCYTYTLHRKPCAENHQAVTYTVRNGVLQFARYANGSEVRVLGQHGSVGTIEALFRSIHRARAAGFSVHVEHHAVYGFPTIISATMPGARDAGYTITVTDFRVLG